MKNNAEQPDLTNSQIQEYCIHAHLSERLDELSCIESSPEIQSEIRNAVCLLEIRLQKTRELYDHLTYGDLFTSCGALVSFLEEMFSLVRRKEDGGVLYVPAFLTYLTNADALLQSGTRNPIDCFVNTKEHMHAPQEAFDPDFLRPLIKLLQERRLAA
ncbi:hypothetical protein [Mucilaginibacter kameinonensis]|uniref:hypothetical protein n=1 Tax=Mucilaginibacter kameinonensis TaxID=452286 RepID=UPI0013CEA993|nr:hypothetical protein [Mucilaginibacter kameinonensis]